MFYLKSEGEVKECEVLKWDNIQKVLNSIKTTLPDHKETDLSAEDESNDSELNVSLNLDIHLKIILFLIITLSAYKISQSAER